MNKVNRRQFIGQSVIGVSSALILSKLPAHFYVQPGFKEQAIGFQVYPIRDKLVKDYGFVHLSAGDCLRKEVSYYYKYLK